MRERQWSRGYSCKPPSVSAYSVISREAGAALRTTVRHDGEVSYPRVSSITTTRSSPRTHSTATGSGRKNPSTLGA